MTLVRRVRVDHCWRCRMEIIPGSVTEVRAAFVRHREIEQCVEALGVAIESIEPHRNIRRFELGGVTTKFPDELRETANGRSGSSLTDEAVRVRSTSRLKIGGLDE